jgi:hypothetical protein
MQHRTELPRRAPSLLALAVCAACAADPPAIESTRQPIVGGQTATTCQWPTTVLLSGCTGTLVHPLIITTAAHCGTNHRMATFGETSGAPARRVPIESCKVFQGENGPDATDFAFCKLRTPVTDVPIIPPLMGCEVDVLKVGQKVVVAGFGDNNDRNGGFGTKRWVETTINRLDTGKGAQIGGMGKAPCYGDSGGPAFVQLADGSWRAFGIDSAGLADSCTAGDIMAMIWKAVPWIEEQSGIDISPCHDADGKWHPGPDCHGFSQDPLATGRSWANGCAEPTLSPPAATCGMAETPSDGGDRVADAAADAKRSQAGADARPSPDLAPDTTAVQPPLRADAAPAGRPDLGPEPEPEPDAAVTSHAAPAGCHCGVGSRPALPAAPLVLALLGSRLARRRRSRTTPSR